MSEISGLSFNSSQKTITKAALKKSPKYPEDARLIDPESQKPLLKAPPVGSAGHSSGFISMKSEGQLTNKGKNT